MIQIICPAIFFRKTEVACWVIANLLIVQNFRLRQDLTVGKASLES